MKRPFAVIVGLGANGLWVARSLGRNRVPVISIVSGLGDLSAKTRYCNKILCKDIKSIPLIDVLLNLAKNLKEKAVLFPTMDSNVKLISKYRDALSDHYHVMLPSHEITCQLLNKETFADYTLKEGFAIPKTYVINTENDNTSVLEQINYPCVVKTIEKIYDEKISTSPKKIESKEDLFRHFDSLKKIVKKIVVQEWIEGPDSNVYFCLQYYSKEHKPLVSFVGRKLRQWKPVTGGTCFAEPIDNEFVLNETTRFFERVRFQGLCSMEFKMDSHSGAFFMTEPTVGRTDYQSGIAVANGVDIPYIAYLDSINEKIPVTKKSRIKIKWIDFYNDVMSARYYIDKGSLTYAAWVKSLCCFLSPSILALDEPYILFQWAANWFGKIFRKLRKLMS